MTFHILPQPLNLTSGRGFFAPRQPVTVLLADPCPQNILAAKALVADLRRYNPIRSSVSMKRASEDCCVILEAPSACAAESYAICVTPDTIHVTGDGAPGLFYGIQTLRQLVRQFGMHIPSCTIKDRPAFPNRAFYLDVSRGRVPRLETLFALADTLAGLKINQLQLYVEHVFAFRFDRSIWRGCNPLTKTEILALDQYCNDRFIRLVPSLACFGHMGRVLSLPQYRKLAEVEWPTSDWEHAKWIHRLRGATINPCSPGSQKLLRNMLDEFLPLFSSGLFNMCGDETYDLGKGANAPHVRRNGLASLYMRHVQFLRREAARHDKTLMFWGDVLQHHPEGIPGIPKDCTVLDWGYERDTDFGKVRRFIDAGREAYVCPATRGYRVVFNEVEEARANISGYAREGFRAGAAGLMTTDWGDMGHFNMPGCSLHGAALGAAMAWNPRGDESKRFDQSFSVQLFNDPSGLAAEIYRKAGTTGIAFWPDMLTSAPAKPPSRSLRTRAVKGCAMAEALVPLCRSLRHRDFAPRQALDEITLACQAITLTAKHLLLPITTPAGKRKLGRELLDFIERYSEVWLHANKPSGLPELQTSFKAAARRLSGGKPASKPITRGDLPG